MRSTPFEAWLQSLDYKTWKRGRQFGKNSLRPYGYRRLHTLLKREGWQVNHNVYRLYLAEGLPMRIKSRVVTGGPDRESSNRKRLVPKSSIELF